MSGCNTLKCCCVGSNCYQRWTVFWDCAAQLFDDPVADAKACWPDASAPSTTWQNISTTVDGCTYEIYVLMGSSCTENSDCEGLDDTDPPDPYLMFAEGQTAPLDCCCCAMCCQPDPVPVTVAIDSTGMTPTAPAGGYITIAPTGPNDWHDGPWIPTPQAILAGAGGGMLFQGTGTYYNCDALVETKPQQAYPNSDPTNPPFIPNPPKTVFVSNGSVCDGTNYAYAVTLNCGYTDDMNVFHNDGYEVIVQAVQWDDMMQGGGGGSPGAGYGFSGMAPAFSYSGTVQGVSLTCVNGKPTGTATVPMVWDSDLYNPGVILGPWDCGSIVVVFA